MNVVDFAAVMLSLCGAVVLIVGGYRLQNCSLADALLNGSSGPFAYTSGDEYVVPARWLSLGALGLAVGRALVAHAVGHREGSVRLILVTFVLASLNWGNQLTQDDRPVLCGSEGIASAAMMLGPFIIVVALAAISLTRSALGRG